MLLADLLKAGPRPAGDVLAAAANAGTSPRSVQRASIALGVVKTRTALRSGWTWRLPDDDVGSGNMLEALGKDRLSFERIFKDAKGPATVEPSRAEVIAARLRKLETARGMKGPFYPQDSRIQAWVQAGISDPDLKEAYERARTDHAGMLTVGIMDKYVSEVMKETV